MTETKTAEAKAPANKKVKPESQGVRPWSLRLLIIYAGIGFYVLFAWSQVGPSILSAIAFNLAVLAILSAIASFTRTLVLRRMLSLFLWGAFMTGVAVIVSHGVVNVFAFAGRGGTEIAMAAIEEIIKLIPLVVLLVVGRKFSTFTMGMTDFILAGAALGAGFSCLEYAAAHKYSTAYGQLAWLPTAEIVNGRMVSGHLIWSSLAAAGIGFGFFFKTRWKVAAIGAAVGLAVSIIDHAAYNYSVVSNDFIAGALNGVALNGYLAFGLWVASILIGLVVDARVLLKAVPQYSEFKVPKGLEGLDGLMAMWDFVIDRRRLAYSLHHYENAPETLKKDAAVTSSLLAQTLINFHIPERRLRTLDAMTREDLTLVAGINDLGRDRDPDSLDDIDLPKHYKLIAPLSQGGMGIIYSGEHVHTGQKLAIKLLHPTFARQELAVERFKHEAKAVGALQHPNLVSITDFGITERRKIPYLVMELIQGINLEQLLKEGDAMPPQRFFTIFDQVLDALSHAHKRMVIHRDMKPSNILLTQTEDGRDMIKIVDFGIAKIMSGEGEEGANTQELTRTGDLIGSPLYMSPEQGLGTKLDARSDIYSVGCVMYECIVGDPPLLGNTAVQTIMMHINESPKSLREARPELNIPAGIDHFIMKCLAKNPAHRYQTMDEMREALHAVRANPFGPQGGGSHQGPPQPPRPQNPPSPPNVMA
ncbi:MAG TPA: protein kinase [Candidatus Melainabacteria bacterium]|nr:protein kinase [Candidatus Melainabacteria bacterium]